MRVVSLLPAATEVVFALGAGATLVGRSHECDFPAAARERAVCTSSKLDAAGTSYAIDARVRATLQEGLSIYRVDAEALDRLRPDVILTQTQCDVCAASLRDVEAALATFVGSQPRLVALAPGSLADVWGDVVRIAAVLGIRAQGEALAASLAARVDAIAAKTKVPASRATPRVACVEWIEPLMAAGNWMPTLVELAHGDNLFGTAGEHSPWMSFAELVAADPDVILVMPCGWDIARARRDLPSLAAHPEWAQLSAVRHGRVFVADGNQYFNRPGPRVVESLEILAELLHGDRCDFGHRGSAYERV